ncbi:MAG: Clp protease N-terminal domain-containing protein, partial [Rhabdochlamydiaceae bacterium]
MLGNLFANKTATTQLIDTSTQIVAGSLPVQPEQPVANDPVQPVTPIVQVAPSTIVQSTTTQPSRQAAEPAMNPTRRVDLSALSHLDARATQMLMHAQQETMRIKQALIMPEQVLFGLLYDEAIYKLLEQFSVDAAKLSRELQSKVVMG